MILLYRGCYPSILQQICWFYQGLCYIDLHYFEVSHGFNIVHNNVNIVFVFFFIEEFQSDTVTVNLVAADPPDACYSVINGEALQKSIALVERG